MMVISSRFYMIIITLFRYLNRIQMMEMTNFINLSIKGTLK